MKQYLYSFAKFSMNESNKFNITKEYTNELKDELHNRLKDQEFNGWTLESYHYMHMSSFLFIKSDSPFLLFITPFFEYSDDSLNISVTYDGWDIVDDDIKNLSSKLTGEKEEDVEILYHLMVDVLKRISDHKNLAKFLIHTDQIPDEDLLKVIVMAGDHKTFSDVVEELKLNRNEDILIQCNPESVMSWFNDYADVQELFEKNIDAWEDAFSKVWEEEECKRFFLRMKKAIRSKKMFGL